MRHALAPGIGDPANFRLSDCTTQRNLSEAGREQARRIGERFRERGIEVGEVRSSRWCRCLETAPGRSSWSGRTRWGWCGWAVCAEGVTDAGNVRGGRWPPLVDLGAHRGSIDAPSITSPAGRARRARSAGTSPRG
ncbi:MAG: histidine phosphatase family protein [Halomonas sp.]|nr:histidine phosphatase family protein [Halomonas sp.]